MGLIQRERHAWPCEHRLGAWLAGLMLWAIGPATGMAAGVAHGPHGGTLELDTRSQYSHLRVKQQGNVRSLLFVRDSGEEVEESLVDLKKPHELLLPYARFMFTSYLFRPQQERVLIVGLGGGAMVHFLTHYDPPLRIDVVEIDPAVVEIAERYFLVRAGEKVNLITADGLEYLEKTEIPYDVVYMDAFLKPSPDTDVTGMPLRLKTEQFYHRVQGKLKPQGLVVFNLNQNKSTETDIATIRSVFGQTYVFRLTSGNVVVVASSSPTRETSAVLNARAREADRQFKTPFSFPQMLSRLSR